MKILVFVVRHAVAALIVVLAMPVTAADLQYPTKPIRLLVGYAPASGADVTARFIAERLQESLKQAVVVENKAGAGGLIAAQELVRAAPDGYTLMLAAMPQISILPAANPKLPYDPQRDFVAVSQATATDLVLVTGTKRVPSTSLQAFVKWAREQPSALFFATPGQGSVAHFGSYVFADALKVKLETVHFKTTSESTMATANGDIHAQLVTHAVAAPLAKAGQLRVLADTGPSRSMVFPDVPTFKELGYPEMQFDSWYGVFAPANTPTEVLDKLNLEVVKATRNSETRAKLEAAGLRVTGTTREEFARVIKSDNTRWAKAVQATGFKMQD